MRAKKEDIKVRGVFEKEPGTGIWWIRYQFEGRPKREKVGRKSDAIALYQQRKSEVRAGTKMPANMRHRGETLGTLIDRASEWYASHRPRSLKTSSGHLAAIKADLGHVVAADLTPAMVDRWLSAHTEWSPATMNRYKCSLGRTLQLAVISGHLKQNVARLVTGRTLDNERVRWLSEDEEKNLRKFMSPELTEMVEFAMHVGSRKGEQFKLTWDRVDFDRKEIRFTKTKTDKDRTVPMSATCYRLLKSLYERKSDNNNMVFQSIRYKAPMGDPKKAFGTAMAKAGIKDFRYHDLRHTFASRLVMRGVDLYTVSKLLGHGSVAVTQRYSHLAQEHLAKAVSALDGVLP